MSYGNLVLRDFISGDFVLKYFLGLLHLVDFVIPSFDFRGFCPRGFCPRSFCPKEIFS